MLDFTVNSHKGPYKVKFVEADVDALKKLGTHFLVDKNVFSADLLISNLKPGLAFMDMTGIVAEL